MRFFEGKSFRKIVFAAIAALSLVSLVIAGFVVWGAVWQGWYMLILSAVMFALIIVVSIFNMIGGYYYLESWGFAGGAAKLKGTPSVAVIVASYNEEPGMVKETLASLKGLDYPKNKISFHLLDDSTDEKIVKELKGFCQKEGVEFARREKREWYKGGAINEFLARCRAEYLAVFDADEKLIDAGFLKETLGFLEQDKSVAFVQTKKKFAGGHMFGNTVDALHSFYFNGVEPVKAKDGSALFCGSCGVLRVSTAKELGGMPKSVTEDTAYSLVVEASGLRGVYLPRVYALGMPIETFGGVSSQHWRYTFGNVALLPSYVKNFGAVRGWKNHLHYFAHMFGLQYVSFIFVALALLTLAIIFSDLEGAADAFTKLFVPGEVQLKLYLETSAIISIGSTLVLIMITSKAYIGDLAYGLRAFFLNFSLSFVRIKATVRALGERYSPFRVARKGTGKGLGVIGSARATLLETCFSGLFLAAGILSVVRSDLAGAFWLFWYGIIFSGAFYYSYRYG